MSKWCIKHQKDLPDFLFYPDNRDKLLCKECIKQRILDRRNKSRSRNDTLEREQEAVMNIVQQLQKDNNPYIYLIEHDSRYKVGYSNNIRRRVKTFNTSHATPCKIIAVVPGDRTLEQEVHKKLVLYHVRGEWFTNSKKVLDLITYLPDSVVFLPGHLSKGVLVIPDPTLGV